MCRRPPSGGRTEGVICAGAVGSGNPAANCRTALGQWVVELLQFTAALPQGSGQWKACHTLPHYLGAVGGGTPIAHCHIVLGQCAAELLLHIATLCGGSGQWDSRRSLLHYLGVVRSGTLVAHRLTAVGNGTLAMKRRTAWEQWAGLANG